VHIGSAAFLRLWGFTYVFIDGDTLFVWWDKKRLGKPSWLDYVLSDILVLLPILLFWLINSLLVKG
jgi:hypothetical protein